MKKLILIILAVLMLSGCAAGQVDTVQTKRTTLNTKVDVLEYPEYNAVCFVSDSINSGGVSCLSLTPTNNE